MNNFENFDVLRQLVDQNGGVVTVAMGQLRDAYGVDRLGVNVKAGIIRELDGRGLKAYPFDLKSYQEELVRIYKAGSPVADIVDAVLNPGDTHDQELRNATGGDSTVIIQKIRELVCD